MSMIFTLLVSLCVVFAFANALCSDYSKNQASCLKSSEDGVKCSFCSSAAAGTTCMKETDAKTLPSSVFQCTYQAGVSQSYNASVAGAQYGLDFSSAASSSSASCFVSNGFTYVVPRGYRSSGAVDTAVCGSLNTAKAAGIATRDVYLFPQPTSTTKSAATQMSELLNYLKTNCGSAWSGRVWLDIEGSQYWTTSTSSNKAFYQALVDSCSANGIRCGVYSSMSQWSSIFGSTSYSYGSSLPLWYAHYDNNPSFSDFSPFAGWTTPHAKQYAGDVTVCSMGVDKNYSPSF